jgi:hypothetical protein
MCIAQNLEKFFPRKHCLGVEKLIFLSQYDSRNNSEKNNIKKLLKKQITSLHRSKLKNPEIGLFGPMLCK